MLLARVAMQSKQQPAAMPAAAATKCCVAQAMRSMAPSCAEHYEGHMPLAHHKGHAVAMLLRHSSSATKRIGTRLHALSTWAQHLQHA
jgi:hypothetical protein